MLGRECLVLWTRGACVGMMWSGIMEYMAEVGVLWKQDTFSLCVSLRVSHYPACVIFLFFLQTALTVGLQVTPYTCSKGSPLVPETWRRRVLPCTLSILLGVWVLQVEEGKGRQAWCSLACSRISAGSTLGK